MTEVLLFHHAQGLTPGVHEFADRLRAGGHTVTVPDLFDGATFPTVQSGVDHAQSIGIEVIIERGEAVAAGLPPGTVYAGFSLGVMPAQKLVQTREGALAGLFLHSAAPPDYFAPAWPSGVPAQVHVMEGDEWGDLDVCKQLEADVPEVEVFRYPGSDHLFTDSSLDVYDAAATEQVLERSLDLLARFA
jgi:dienelactone hydrolase